MTTMQKRCENCGGLFDRRPGLSASQWSFARFCSRPCAAKVIRKPNNPLETFWSNVMPEPNSGCWLWLGTIDANGYGQFMANGILYSAHRFSLELHKGPIPDGMSGLHHCDNRACANPDHLYAGTHDNNVHDAVNRARHSFGERHGNAKLTAEAVRKIRASELSDAALADIYGVSRTAVRHARDGETWRSVS